MNGTKRNNKIRLVVLSAFFDPYMSGAEQMVKEIVERLGGTYQITLITCRLDKKLPKNEDRDSYQLVRVGFGFKFDKYFYPFLAILKLRKYKPQIIHAIMESYAGVALVLSKYIIKTKRVLTLQSGDLDDPSKKRKLIIRLFWKQIHLVPDVVTAISSFLAQRALALGKQKDLVKVIPNGVDFNEIPQVVSSEKNRVVCIARLSWEKGIDYLLKAWPEVIKIYPDANLVLVGEGNKRNEIENLIAELKIGSSVSLKGNLPHTEALTEIKKSTVFICPSLAEGLGNVFIEAQACQVSVIGTKVGGIPDIISNNENGLLIEPKNSEQIAISIIKLLSKPELRNELVTNANHSVQKFNWDNIVKQMSEVYQEVLS